MNVAKRDQSLVLASVRPIEHPEIVERIHRLKDALVAGVDREDGFLFLFILDLEVASREEVRRRKLTLIPRDYQLSPPQDCRHRLSRANLARLVEDDNI